eukprot:CAMPEP_0206014432 /NCGR_PEP_ID=MMETSP1464-20131121/18321_1 /ASSEMBLY_ACC=CAM_ASM_001124 /TAXON_ID=119497 /ORGANISM="Exanthemachrysis gayraliae, Strain RCC1523" /LENGTH=56 /DNA_ID=CAMNT_0053388185 /DNA_START=8 /DNA_END=178 /DNA_ORIENTATION=+
MDIHQLLNHPERTDGPRGDVDRGSPAGDGRAGLDVDATERRVALAAGLFMVIDSPG